MPGFFAWKPSMSCFMAVSIQSETSCFFTIWARISTCFVPAGAGAAAFGASVAAAAGAAAAGFVGSAGFAGAVVGVGGAAEQAANAAAPAVTRPTLKMRRRLI